MHRQLRSSRAAGVLMLIGALGFTAAAVFPHLYTFVFGSLLGLTCSAAAIPLITQIYQDNYDAKIRGNLFSRQLFIRIGSACAFGWIASILLENRLAKHTADSPLHIAPFQYLMAAFAAALFLSAYALFRIPSSPLTDPGKGAGNPFYALRFIRDDRTFRNTLIAWMLIGTANLMMQALRVEYLANTGRFHVTLNNLPLTAFFIALLTDIIPNAARLLMSPIWGHVFDRLNFFLLRIAINLGFGIAIFTFFTGDSYAGHVAGAIIWGVSIAGGDLCWSLWVTKLAPPHRVAHYMSVHTFLTGLRGIAAPFLAFSLVGHLSLFWMASLTAAMILLSCLVLVPELTAKRPLTREVEEQLGD
jgi:hypothetical protein